MVTFRTVFHLPKDILFLAICIYRKRAVVTFSGSLQVPHDCPLGVSPLSTGKVTQELSLPFICFS